MCRYETLTHKELEAIKHGRCPDCKWPGDWIAESAQEDAADWRCGHCGTLFHFTHTGYVKRVVIDPPVIPASCEIPVAASGANAGSASGNTGPEKPAAAPEQSEPPQSGPTLKVPYTARIITTKGSARKFGKGRD